MYGYRFPHLDRWFKSDCYIDRYGCRFLNIKMRDDLYASDIKDLYTEFAVYVCSLRCQSKDLFIKMKNAITRGDVLLSTEREMLRDAFFTGFISQEKYKSTGDYKLSFDDDAIQGYLGEALYYLVRDYYVEDEKISIEPDIPKYYSKEPGIDFLEVRKENGEYYFVIGEVKTSINSVTARNSEVINSFLNRMNRNFGAIYTSLKEKDTGTDPDYSNFLEEMLSIFYNFTIDDRKRVAGVFNYMYKGRNIRKDAFSDWEKEALPVKDESVCRRIKVIGIYNIDEFINCVRDIIWNIL